MKKIIYAVTFLIMGMFIEACAMTASAEQEYPLKIWKENENGYSETWCLVDENTGVNYIVVTTGDPRGGVAITPRLNLDGTLYITESHYQRVYEYDSK